MDPLFFNLSGMSDLQLTLAEERLRLGLPFEQHPGPLLDATMALGPDLEATHPLAEGSGGPIGVRQGQDTGAGGSDDVYLNQMCNAPRKFTHPSPSFLLDYAMLYTYTLPWNSIFFVICSHVVYT